MNLSATLLLFSIALPCAGRAADSPPSPSPGNIAIPHPARVSGSISDALFTALQKQDYAAAYHLFDDKMKAAVPEEKLRALWSVQLAPMGAFLSWTSAPGAPNQGLDLTLAALKFEHGELRAAVYVNPQSGLVSGFFVKPASTPATSAAAYVDSTKFQALDVTVGSDPFVLGGTLTVPRGRGPFPAAVLIHGSGPQDRDETVGANRVFKDLAEGLASRGVVVLRYEKRTKQYGATMTGVPNIEDEVMADAVAAVSVLRSRPEVDRNRIFVVGHSLGALLAPEIGVRSAPVAGVALLAPPGRPPWEMVVAQLRYLDTPKEELAETERKVALLKTGKLGDEKLLNVPQSYWQDWAARDGVAVAKKLARPVLILRGERDYQVAQEDVENWKKGLSGVPNVEVVVLPGLNHLFIQGSGKPGPAEYDILGHVDSRVIEKLGSFMTAGTAQGAAPR